MVPNGSVRCAAVRARASKCSPLAVLRPTWRPPYQVARPLSLKIGCSPREACSMNRDCCAAAVLTDATHAMRQQATMPELLKRWEPSTTLALLVQRYLEGTFHSEG